MYVTGLFEWANTFPYEEISLEVQVIHQVAKVNTFKHVQSLEDSVKRVSAIFCRFYR